MEFYKSPRERNLWLWAMIVTILIYSSLWLTGLFGEILAESTLLVASFAGGLLLITLTVIMSGLVRRQIWQDTWLIAGMVSVYGMILVRLGLPERSHLIEYSVLALLVYSALLERHQHGGNIKFPGLLAVVITGMLGLIDELVQIFLPNRVYDPQDIIFNISAAILAVGTITFLRWIKQRISKKVS